VICAFADSQLLNVDGPLVGRRCSYTLATIQLVLALVRDHLDAPATSLRLKLSTTVVVDDDPTRRRPVAAIDNGRPMARRTTVKRLRMTAGASRRRLSPRTPSSPPDSLAPSASMKGTLAFVDKTIRIATNLCRPASRPATRIASDDDANLVQNARSSLYSSRMGSRLGRCVRLLLDRTQKWAAPLSRTPHAAVLAPPKCAALAQTDMPYGVGLISPAHS
jgi:hypothetical protein